MLNHHLAVIQGWQVKASANYVFGSLTRLSRSSIVREREWVMTRKKVQGDVFAKLWNANNWEQT